MHQNPGAECDATRRTVMAAVRRLDGPTVRDALLQSLLTAGVDATVTEVAMPVLREVGDGWQSGQLGVLHEHFVSSAFRGVLGEFRMPVPGERVRTAVLACPAHELHDLPLELFGAMLHSRWWRVVSLGANTPMGAVGDAVRHLGADACVLAGVRRSALDLLSLTDFPTLAGIWAELGALQPEIIEQLEVDAQYAGYLDRQDADIVAFRRDEGRSLPSDLDYGAVSGLSNEVRHKLERIRPTTLGQAARIEGMTPAALTLVLAHVKGGQRAKARA